MSKAKKKAKPEDRSVDPASVEMLEVAEKEGVKTAWDRLEAMGAQCKFGKQGICCRICTMGPCRITPKSDRGVCGATADTIVARNLLRMVCAGAAAHSDHGRNICHALALAASGQSKAYTIKGKRKLMELAREYGVETKDREVNDIAGEVAEILLNDFGRQHGHVLDVKRAPETQQKNWERAGVTPRGIDREIVTAMHATNMGVDTDAEHILLTGFRVGLGDGWGGSMIATDVSDVLFGEPHPLRAEANLGVLKAESVNIIVHGHEPTLSDVIVAVSQDPEILEAAKAKGAKGVNLAGICCTANEVLMRHGIPLAGNVIQQELAAATGVVDVMLVDVQCIYPALAEACNCFHTKMVATSPNAKFPGAEYIEFHEEEAWETAKKIVMMAIENFAKRDPDRIHVPDEKQGLIAGFTTEVVRRILGGRYRPSFRPLNDGIMTGRLRGAAGVVGCNNPKKRHDHWHLEVTRELIRNEVAVVMTGCAAIACAKAGLMDPAAAEEHAGKGLAEICRAVGIPPVLHLGSCVDNSRILTIGVEMVKEGGIGEDISQLPLAGAAPEWMSEKAVSIGMYVVASGIFTVFPQPLPVMGSEFVTEWLTKGCEEYFGATWAFIDDPIEAAHAMIDHIDRKRAALNLAPLMYEVPYKPKVQSEAAAVTGAGS